MFRYVELFFILLDEMSNLRPQLKLGVARPKNDPLAGFSRSFLPIELQPFLSINAYCREAG